MCVCMPASAYLFLPGCFCLLPACLPALRVCVGAWGRQCLSACVRWWVVVGCPYRFRQEQPVRTTNPNAMWTQRKHMLTAMSPFYEIFRQDKVNHTCNSETSLHGRWNLQHKLLRWWVPHSATPKGLTTETATLHLDARSRPGCRLAFVEEVLLERASLFKVPEMPQPRTRELQAPMEGTATEHKFYGDRHVLWPCVEQVLVSRTSTAGGTLYRRSG